MTKMAPVIIKPREPLQESSFPPVKSRKRKNDEVANSGVNDSVPAPLTKMPKGFDDINNEKKRQESVILMTYPTGANSSTTNKKARETRLEQNRKAARESRRRKKVMIEDLQRSVIFFSRANGALKHQNDELTRLFMQAQAQVSVIESTNAMNNTQSSATTTVSGSQPQQDSQHQHTLAASSENESRTGADLASSYAVAPAQATAAAQVPSPAIPAPAMQPGATMQAMASFQQAAAAAMQVAVQGMRGISPGASLTSLTQPSATTGSANAQQAYNDTMTALAMQQAAIAAAAVPSHLMAQIVNSGAWAAPQQAPAAGTPVAPATIFPAASTQGSGTTPSSITAAVPVAAGSTASVAAPVAVAPMPLTNLMTMKGAQEL